MPKRTPLDWDVLEQELHDAGVPRPRSRPGHVGCSPRRAHRVTGIVTEVQNRFSGSGRHLRASQRNRDRRGLFGGF